MATTKKYERNMVLATETFNVVGTRPVRHDGTDKVTGRAQYGADFTASDMLYGKILRSPYAHANIKAIDTSKAEAHPGVRAVITGDHLPLAEPGIMVDLGEGSDNLRYLRTNILARTKVLYKGHAVAAVAAINLHAAEEAVGLIEVEYEELQSVMTAPEAMKKDAPILNDDIRTKNPDGSYGETSNLAEHVHYEKGDIAKGFAEADVVIEKEFNTSTVHQGYIEPQNATALWNNDGRLEIWCSTQGSFTVRDTTAAILDLPVSQVKVTPMEIGGGFGGKIPVYLEPVAAIMSKMTGHSVKMVMSRDEVFEGTGPTPGSYLKVRIGVKNDGDIVAAQAYMAYEAGAFPGAFVNTGAMCIFSPYDIPNVLIDGYDVVVNKPKTKAYRAPGATNGGFAAETIIDEIAAKLQIDPLEFRLKNAAKEGTRRPDGPVFQRIGCIELIEAMQNHPHYKAPIDGPNQGRGVAIGFWFNVGFTSSCAISVNADGTINLVEGSTDIGGSRAAIAMQAAEVLGLKAEEVYPKVVDTDSIGYTSLTGGSRVAFSTGYAAYEAAQDVKHQMIERAARIWDIDRTSVEFNDGVFQSKTDTELKMNFKELAGELANSGGPVMGRATVKPGGVGGSFSGNIVDVEVDPETGKVEIKRFTAFQDAGKAVHPSYVEGQMQGGSVQGIGWGLNEEYYMSENGHMLNSTLLDYRMPTSLDLPMIDTVIVEVANPGHPFGVRGVGEASIIPPPAAIANAIHAAVGVRLGKLPMNPSTVMKKIWEQNK